MPGTGRWDDAVRQDAGFRYMWLGVWVENHKTQRFYERLGYRTVGDHDFIIGACI
jgi:ribosomal protein S18 acetylase RimI-like enzyme